MAAGAKPGALVLVVGRPATGKSYFARLIAQRTSAVLVQTDSIRKQMFPEPTYSGWESGLVYQTAYRRIQGNLEQGLTVIFDATNLLERMRAPIYRIAERAGARLVIALVWAPLTLIKRRLEERAAGLDPLDRSDADWRVFQKLNRLEPIRRPHLLVNTAVDLQQAVDLVCQRLSVEERAG